MHSKRVLFFATDLSLGGGERVTTDIMNHLVGIGIDVVLVSINIKGSGFKLLDSRIKIIELNSKRFVSAIPSLTLVIRKIKPDTVFSSSVHANIILLLAAKISFTKCRIVVRVGSPLSVVFNKFQSIKDKVFIPILTKILYRRSDVIVAVSKGIASDLEKVIGSGKNIKVIYSPKDIDFIRGKSKEYLPDVFKKSGPTILFVGRLVEQKDIPTLIKAFEMVKEDIPGAKLVIVGDGNQDLIRGKDVYFEGVKDNPYVYMENANLMALSSKWEGLPNVVLEALVCGLPVVSTDCVSGGPREILSPDSDYNKRLNDSIENVSSGYLVPVGSINLLSKAIKMALSREDYSFDCSLFENIEVMKRYVDVL
ncbi:MAG: glycosyltransferase [Candidatus Pacebacteria bacterium]|nr:glycosyltransferase [Candidatus Paceibacterota bacterium]